MSTEKELADLKEQLHAIREMIQDIIITDGVDKGVIMYQVEPRYIVDTRTGKLRLMECLASKLLELHELTGRWYEP